MTTREQDDKEKYPWEWGVERYRSRAELLDGIREHLHGELDNRKLDFACKDGEHYRIFVEVRVAKVPT